ncbi:MAG TPA: PfkB family carbohydrate kinase [Micromonosporaceae bacterium]
MTGLVVVVGDVLLDRDIVGIADRLSPDAPVPVLTETAQVQRPGGAGLAALFLALAGAEVQLIGAFGKDPAGQTVRALLAEAGVRVSEMPYSGQTPEKVRLRAGGHPLLRLDRGVSPGPLGEPTQAQLAELHRATAVLVSDYGRGVTALPGLRRALADTATRVPVVWDPHPKGSTPVAAVRAVCPNRVEAAGFAAARGVDIDDRPVLARDVVAVQARLLRTAWRAYAVAVTMGSHGALIAEGDRRPVHVPAPATEGGDTCGAGDRFSAELTMSLARGAEVATAVADAVDAASKYVAANGPQSLSTSFVMEESLR